MKNKQKKINKTWKEMIKFKENRPRTKESSIEATGDLEDSVS